MNARFPPLMTAVVGATVLSLGGLLWLGREMRLPGQANAMGNLLEMLQASPNAEAPPRQGPPPPVTVAWNSPMADVCPPVDGVLAQRLLPQVASLPRRVQRIPTDPTNFGERFNRDAFGNPVDPRPRVVVLHETVFGMQSAISTFLTPHPRDEDQVSYHTLVGLDGRIVQVLDPSKRAFGAGNSAFEGQWVVTNRKVGGSINNFALHLSLETPVDGEHDGPEHSGYSPVQYDATALVLADWMRRYQIPWENITTHRHVDLGGERADPRSFDWEELKRRLVALGVASC